MTMKCAAALLIWVATSSAQVIYPPIIPPYIPQLTPQPEVDRMQQQNQLLQQQLQQQQAIQSQQALQQTQQMQFQRQTEDMMRGLTPLAAQTNVTGGGLGVLSGKWWYRPALATRLGLTADQQKKMDDIYQQARIKMIDLTAAFQKEQAVLEPLTMADQPDEAMIAAQIDKAGKARVELEKANAGMLLETRRVLTPEQWAKLKAVVAGE
jgi:Spy/CpxP family protein refolding chaperone